MVFKINDVVHTPGRSQISDGASSESFAQAVARSHHTVFTAHPVVYCFELMHAARAQSNDNSEVLEALIVSRARGSPVLEQIRQRVDRPHIIISVIRAIPINEAYTTLLII